MSLKRKPKICKTCNKPKVLFSNGNCKECSLKVPKKQTSKSTSTKTKKLPTIAKLKKDARYWFQRWIRLRDQHTLCIYGSGVKLDDIRNYDACHYLKFELYPEAGFDENNVYGGSKGENIRDNTLAYRRELVLRKGEDFVKTLEDKYMLNREKTYKFSREFLEDIIKEYKTRCKEIEDR